jgi:acetyl-CoA carboxylase carboxyl transferase subunit alpha
MYENMSAEEIMLDRYNKFRKLGMFEEYLVRGGDREGAKEALAKAPGAHTKAGTYAPTSDDAEFLEMLTDMDEKWQKTLASKQDWVMKPDMPAPGFTTPGLLELAIATAEVSGKKIGVSSINYRSDSANGSVPTSTSETHSNI